MRKIIKRKIHISTHKRDLIDFINDEFYSHDKHNAFLEFTMKSLPTDNIIVLFYFQKTKRYVETKAFVDGDKFTIEFDTSLINTDETVLGFIYFEKVAQSADVHRFSFGVKVSEIDKLHDIPIEEAKTKRVVAVEDIVTKAELDELFKRIEKNGGTYNDAEIRSSISSISERVQTLEAKPDNDTRYDDSDVKSRLSTLESNSSRYLTKHQPLTSIEERIQQVEARFNNLSNIYLSSHQSLEHLATNDALGKIEQRVEQLEAIDVTNFATKQELDALRNSQPSIENRLTALENKSTVDTTDFAKKSEIPQPYNDSALTERVSLLEAKAIANGAYDDKPLLDKIRAIEEQFRNASNLYLQSHQSLEHLVTKKELEDKHYLTSVPEEYAKKSELPAPYNDSALVSRINALEVKTDNDTVYNDTEVKQRLTALESRPTGQSEMRGTGMPNGVVEAPIGTTYVDTAKTNGALKWIKTTDGGNQGWKVVEGDTGWVLGWQEDKGNNKNRMYFRRINDVVHVKFEPKISDNVNAHEYNLILDTGGSDIFSQLSIQGFQSVDNIVQTIFQRTIDIPGDTYSAENSEASQGCGAVCLHYVYNNDSKRELELHIVTSQFSSDENHVNPFSYLTEDEWPTEFPTL